MNNKQPAIFIGHGSPMNALEDNEFTKVWKKIGQRYNPKRILVISAHWLTQETEIYAGLNNRTIYDFYGFPKELNNIKYEPAVADFSELSFKKNNTWGLDHGAWSVLVHMFPKKDIPVAQLSINKTLSLNEHIELAKKLDSLRNTGTLILLSGNIVHNLGMMDWSNYHQDKDFIEYNNLIVDTLLNKPAKLVGIIQTSFLTKKAHPTAEHLLPLLYFYGASYLSDQPIQVIINKLVLNSISMTSFVRE